eukprot:CAMPEP_0194312994 /NCGR_PEP_ID=MMETSP0171-20130528/9891_1 /TAXON_ID=218684 /ORGANISM="Corethron pennatum, Strain L29A3" /LENGTH=67 /DNA_ID=CAMNT_0039067743 /DNA_START=197 /DNA_END=400 /DNA_ORIENTATION=+
MTARTILLFLSFLAASAAAPAFYSPPREVAFATRSALAGNPLERVDEASVAPERPEGIAERYAHLRL